MKSLKLLLIISVIIFTGTIAAPAANNERVTGKVLSYGIYKIAKSKSKVAAPDAVTGDVLLVDKFVHVETTDVIPLVLGKSFGFKFRISNIPTDRLSKFTFVTTHPPIMTSQGEYKTKSSFELIGVLPESEIENYFTYELTTQSELVPGAWTLEIWRNGRKLVSKSFKIK